MGRPFKDSWSREQRGRSSGKTEEESCSSRSFDTTELGDRASEDATGIVAKPRQWRRKQRERRRRQAWEQRGCQTPRTWGQQFEEEREERQRRQQARHEFNGAADDDAKFSRGPISQRLASNDDALHADGSEKGKEPKIPQREEGSDRDPWWFILRRQRRRAKQRFGNEGHHYPSSNAPADHPTPSGFGPRVRERHGRRTGHHSWSKLDGQRVAEETAMGQVQGPLQISSNGRRRLRVCQKWQLGGGGGGPAVSEHEEQVTSSVGGRRLADGLAFDWIGRPASEAGICRQQSRDGNHQQLHEQFVEASKEGARDRHHQRGGSRIDPSAPRSWHRGIFPWERGRDSRFLRYYTWLQQCIPSTSSELSGDRESLFPSALPYPEVQSEQRGTIAGKNKAGLWARSYLNFWVAWSNYVVLGCPDCRGAVSEPLVSYGCGRRMRSFTNRLLGEVEEFMLDVACTGEVTCDGKRASLEESLELLVASNASYGVGILPGGVSSKLSAALPVTADRIAIPEVAGTVDPRDCLDDEKAQILDRLESFRLPPDQWKDVVKACHRVSEGEESSLIRKLLNSKMVTLIPESDLPRDHSGELMGGGFFCVAKNESEDRLVFDRRPENATMQRLKWSELPSAACFCRVLLQEDEYLRGSSDDLRNYYYALALPPNWIKYNSVGRRVDPSIVAEWGGDPNISYRAAMRVLGMGDTNACDIAQAVHVHILTQAGLLSDATRLTYGEMVPQGPLLEGAYLDDLLIVSRRKMSFKIPLDGTFIPPGPQASDLDMRQTQAAENAYQKAGLQRAVHKSFRACEQFKAWGASIDGIQGTVGAPLGVRQQVWWLILRVVQQGHCSKQLLQRVLGYICFIFQFRREFYSLQHHVYKYIDGMKEDCNY